MEISLQGGVTMPQALPGARGADFPPVATTTQSDAGNPQRVPATGDTPSVDTEQQRYQAVARAAESFFQDVYAVSDKTFTIFKDSSGQYITRYTSLRDGKVVYIPEPEMLNYFESRSNPRQSLVEIKA